MSNTPRWPNRLRVLREDRRWTQAQVAERAGRDWRVYQRWESGQSKPRYEALVDLARIFQVEVEELEPSRPAPLESAVFADLLERVRDLERRVRELESDR